LDGIFESSLAIWKNNGSWVQSGWNGTRVLDTANNIVGVNITTFGSTFAPLGSTITNLTGCGSIDASGNYILGSNISSGGTCITINASNVTLDCQGYSITGNGTGYGISNNGFDNGVVKNCVISKFSRGMYYYSNANYNNLTNNTINNTGTGVYLLNSQYNNFKNNVIHNASTGAYLRSSSNNILINNTLDSIRGFAIFYILLSSNDTLDKNTITKNPDVAQQGLVVYGSALEEYQHNITTDNTINGLPINYYDGLYRACPDNTFQNLSSNYSEIGLVSCTNVSVTATNNLDHVLLAYTSNSSITGVNLSSTYWPILLFASSGNTIANSTANSNGNAGIDRKSTRLNSSH
jgi:parallel beta-helix repeat protein